MNSAAETCGSCVHFVTSTSSCMRWARSVSYDHSCAYWEPSEASVHTAPSFRPMIVGRIDSGEIIDYRQEEGKNVSKEVQFLQLLVSGKGRVNAAKAVGFGGQKTQDVIEEALKEGVIKRVQIGEYEWKDK